MGFDDKIKVLREFVQSKNRWPQNAQRVPAEERILAGWVTQQRFACKKNKLTAQQIHVLESIAGWRWDAPESKGVQKCGRGSGWMAQIKVAQHKIRGPQRSSAAQAKEDYIHLKEAAPGGVDEVLKRKKELSVPPPDGRQVGSNRDAPGTAAGNGGGGSNAPARTVGECLRLGITPWVKRPAPDSSVGHDYKRTKRSEHENEGDGEEEEEEGEKEEEETSHPSSN